MFFPHEENVLTDLLSAEIYGRLEMCSNTGHSSLAMGTFYKGRKKLRVFFNEGDIIWNREESPSKHYTLPMENVIAVKHNYLRKTYRLDQKQIDCESFTIHYSEKGKHGKWLYKSLALKHSDALQVSTWVKTLQSYLERFKTRPKRLLLFINPFGGKRNGLQIYEKYGKPLFEIAGVEVIVNISQRVNQIKDYIINHNLDMFDSIACVGGDGTVSELLNGLIHRECRLRNIDPNDINQDLPKPKIPVGIIPGGTTDAIAYGIHGTTDPTTAVLHIIFGDSLGLDLISVYDDHSLIYLCTCVLSYGYLGDVIYHSDRYRWMGPIREDYTGFMKLLKNRCYKSEIDVYTDLAEIEELSCKESCEKCKLSKKTEKETSSFKWQTLSGKFLMVSGANISGACDRAPTGIAPYSHLGDGLLHLVMVQQTSVLNNLRLFMRWWCGNPFVEDLPFVRTISAKEFRFRAIEGNGMWNRDGEVERQANVQAKVRCQLVTVFSRGNSNYSPSKLICCGY